MPVVSVAPYTFFFVTYFVTNVKRTIFCTENLQFQIYILLLLMYLFSCSHFRTQPGILEKFKSILAVVQYQLFFLERNEIATEFQELKFIYSEKATKFCEIFSLLLTVFIVVNSKGKISQNFVAFSEYMNFNYWIEKRKNHNKNILTLYQ